MVAVELRARGALLPSMAVVLVACGATPATAPSPTSSASRVIETCVIEAERVEFVSGTDENTSGAASPEAACARACEQLHATQPEVDCAEGGRGVVATTRESIQGPISGTVRCSLVRSTPLREEARGDSRRDACARAQRALCEAEGNRCGGRHQNVRVTVVDGVSVARLRPLVGQPAVSFDPPPWGTRSTPCEVEIEVLGAPVRVVTMGPSEAAVEWLREGAREHACRELGMSLEACTTERVRVLSERVERDASEATMIASIVRVDRRSGSAAPAPPDRSCPEAIARACQPGACPSGSRVVAIEGAPVTGPPMMLEPSGGEPAR